MKNIATLFAFIMGLAILICSLLGIMALLTSIAFTFGGHNR